MTTNSIHLGPQGIKPPIQEKSGKVNEFAYDSYAENLDFFHPDWAAGGTEEEVEMKQMRSKSTPADWIDIETSATASKNPILTNDF